MNESFSFDTYFHSDLGFNFEELETISTMNDPNSHEEYHSEVIHEGKKVQLCNFPGCGKTFKFRSEITRHLVIHFVERPFACPVEGCHRAFKRADALENHSLLHSQELTFRCLHPDCELRFLTRSALKYHMLKHDDQKLFVCGFEGCGRSFLTRAQLKQHEKADNFHKKMAIINYSAVLDQPKPLKRTKTTNDTLDHSFNNFMVEQPPRLTKSLVWDFKDSEQSANSSDTTQTPEVSPQKVITSSVQRFNDFEEFEDLQQFRSSSNQTAGLETVFQQVLEENRLLKQKLEVYGRMMDAFCEGEKVDDQLPKVNRAEEGFQCGLQFMMPGQMTNLGGANTVKFMNFC